MVPVGSVCVLEPDLDPWSLSLALVWDLDPWSLSLALVWELILDLGSGLWGQDPGVWLWFGTWFPGLGPGSGALLPGSWIWRPVGGSLILV